MNCARFKFSSVPRLILLTPAVLQLGLVLAWSDSGDEALKAFFLNDYDKALQFARPAAEQGDITSEYVLGRMYDGGKGVPEDQAAADKWYRAALKSALAAAQKGDARAQSVLGDMYLKGKGVGQSDVEAAAWFLKSAEQGYAPAEHNVSALYQNGRGLGRDDQKAIIWLRRAAEHGFALSQYFLGFAFENGYIVEKNERDAAYWYRKAADQDFTPEKRERKPGDLWDKAVAASDRRRTAAAQALKPAEALAPAAKAAESEVDRPRYGAPEDPNKFAVVIGIEKYSSDLPDAEFAERDAQAVRKHLIALGYPPRNIAFLLGPKASIGSIRKNLETWLPNHINEKSTVFFYYSGHGSPDPTTGQAYLIPWDGDPQYLQDTAIPMKKVYERLNALKAKQVIVALDSCFSGLKGRSVVARGTKPLVNKVDLGMAGRGKVISLSASAGDEISGTMSDQGHGVFTYYLLQGLNGAAADKDGRVTILGLYKYLAPQVEDAASKENRSQTPQLQPAVLGGEAQVRLR